MGTEDKLQANSQRVNGWEGGRDSGEGGSSKFPWRSWMLKKRRR